MSDGEWEEKLYLFLGFEGDQAIFLKPTSQTGYYEKRPELLSGCVVYPPGEVPIFTKLKTIIDAGEPFWKVPRAELEEVLRRAPQRKLTVLPADFDAKLRKAIAASKALGEKDRQRRRAVIDSPV